MKLCCLWEAPLREQSLGAKCTSKHFVCLATTEILLLFSIFCIRKLTKPKWPLRGRSDESTCLTEKPCLPLWICTAICIEGGFKVKQRDRGFSRGSVVNNPSAMQKTWVRFLIQEDPTCCGATESVGQNYWACALEPGSRNKRIHCTTARESPSATKTQHSQVNK